MPRELFESSSRGVSSQHLAPSCESPGMSLPHLLENVVSGVVQSNSSIVLRPGVPKADSSILPWSFRNEAVTVDVSPFPGRTGGIGTDRIDNMQLTTPPPPAPLSLHVMIWFHGLADDVGHRLVSPPLCGATICHDSNLA